MAPHKRRSLKLEAAVVLVMSPYGGNLIRRVEENGQGIQTAGIEFVSQAVLQQFQ